MDKRIDLRFRKPTRTKGTPFFVQRNYWAGGVIAIGGLCWFLMELTPGVKKIKSRLNEHLKDSPEFSLRVKHMQAAWGNPALHSLLIKAKEKEAYQNEPEPESRIFKLVRKIHESEDNEQE